MRTHCLYVALMLLPLILGMFGQTKQGNVQVVVLDYFGDPVPTAQISSRYNGEEDFLDRCETDESGKCSFSLSAGLYRLKVSKDGYSPSENGVQVYSGKESQKTLYVIRKDLLSRREVDVDTSVSLVYQRRRIDYATYSDLVMRIEDITKMLVKVGDKNRAEYYMSVKENLEKILSGNTPAPATGSEPNR